MPVWHSIDGLISPYPHIPERRTSLSFPLAVVVVDEAHHVYKDGHLRDLVEQHVKPGARRLLLSDLSQSYGRKIRYPDGLKDVELTEVVRNSKRIVAGAAQFQLQGDQNVSTTCFHDSTGPPLKAFLFDLPKEATRRRQEQGQGGYYATYAEYTLQAFDHVLTLFPGLRLHNRLAIVVPDGEFESGLRSAYAACTQPTLSQPAARAQ